MSQRAVGGFHAAGGVCLYYGRDRWGQPFVAVSRGRDSLVWGRELRVTFGGWPVFQCNRQCVCVHRLWVEFC